MFIAPQLLVSVALAAGLDGHGPTPPSAAGEPALPLRSWYPVRQVGVASFGGLFEFADRTVVLRRQGAGEIVDENQLAGLFGINLQASYGVHERVGLALNAPLWLTAGGVLGSAGGPTPGDFHLSAPVGLVLPQWDDTGASLALVPHLRLPTGDAERLLGDGSVGGGATMAFGYRTLSGLIVSANAGFDSHPTAEEQFGSGGGELRYSLSGGKLLGDSMAVHGELIGGFGLSADASGRRNIPLEWTGSLRGSAGKVWWTAGAGTGITGALGVASIRAFGGLGAALETREIQVPQFTFTVVDGNGEPIEGAEVRQGGEVLGVSDVGGVVQAPLPIRWTMGLGAEADGYESAAFVDPGPKGTAARVELNWNPVELVVLARDPKGQPVTEPTVELKGPETPPAPTLRDDGGLVTNVHHGTWTVVVSGKDRVATTHEVVVKPGQRRAALVETILPQSGGDAELTVRAKDASGRPAANALVFIDAEPVGLTGDDGELQVSGLLPGEREVRVEGHGHIATTSLAAGTADITLLAAPGSVSVRVEGGAEGTVGFTGSATVAPLPLVDGARSMVLGDGLWSARIETAEGVQTREVLLDGDKTDIVVVPLAEKGDGKLVVRLVDPDGIPVGGAEVRVDGQPVGTTASGGTVGLEGIATGLRKVEIASDRLQTVAARQIDVSASGAELIVPVKYKPGTTHLRMRTPKGVVDDGFAFFTGPSELDSVKLDAVAGTWMTLPPGTWDVSLVSESRGIQNRLVDVASADGRLHRVDVRVTEFDPEAFAELTLDVVDLEGPLVGAVIRLDNDIKGTTSSGGQVHLTAEKSGRRKLRVTLPGYGDYTRDINLSGGVNSEVVEMRYAPGATRVKLVAGGKPVKGIVRYANRAGASGALPVDGERVLPLRPGPWQLMAVTDDAVAVRKVTVPKKPVHEAIVDLVTPRPQTAEMLVQVRDPWGNPVPYAMVKVGATFSKTDVGGATVVKNLPLRPLELRASATSFKETKVPVELQEGVLERTVQLGFQPANLTINLKNAEGKPVDGWLAAAGPLPFDRIAITNGTGKVELAPGEWAVIGGAQGLGVQRRALKLRPGANMKVDLILRDAQVSLDEGEFALKKQVFSLPGSSRLRSDSQFVLDELANLLIARDDLGLVEVAGHAYPEENSTLGPDQRMDDQALFQVSRDRAETVRQELIRKGVPAFRLVARGYGPTRPQQLDDPRAKQRHVDFRLID